MYCSAEQEDSAAASLKDATADEALSAREQALLLAWDLHLTRVMLNPLSQPCKPIGLPWCLVGISWMRYDKELNTSRTVASGRSPEKPMD